MSTDNGRPGLGKSEFVRQLYKRTYRMHWWEWWKPRGPKLLVLRIVERPPTDTSGHLKR